jgi:hypothetical protein
MHQVDESHNFFMVLISPTFSDRGWVRPDLSRDTDPSKPSPHYFTKFSYLHGFC